MLISLTFSVTNSVRCIHKSQILLSAWYFLNLQILKQFFRLCRRYRRGYDQTAAGFPVDRCRELVLRSELKTVYHPQDFVEVAAGGGRVENRQFEFTIRTDDGEVSGEILD